MCLKPKPLPPVPEETRRVAHQIYPPDHLLRRIGEDYADVLRDEDFADLYPAAGQPALSPALLALVTVLQATEHCSDRLAAEMVRLAAEMVRSRIDWKYALHLPLDYRGFDASVLCEFRQRLVAHQFRQRLVAHQFRQRLVAHQAQRRAFDAFLQRLKERGFLRGRAVQRTDSLAILATVRELSQLELVMETLRLALEAVAQEDPRWLQSHVATDWLRIYGAWTQDERLIREKGERASAETLRLLSRTGQDGFTLLDALEAEDAAALRSLPAVDVLRTVWSQQYQRPAPSARPESSPSPAGAPAPNPGVPRGVKMMPASAVDDGQRGQVVVTPHDPQARRATKRGHARRATKRGHAWNGYKLHLTETATEDAPLIITDVDVVAAAAHDSQAVDPIQERLRARDLLPQTHLADAGYVNGPAIHASQVLRVDLLGPVPADTYGLSRKEKILPAEAFAVDVENRRATCPGGHVARLWSLYHHTGREGHSLVAIAWDKQTCAACPLRGRCLPPGQSQRILRLSPHYTLLTARRAEQSTPAFRERYRRRAGIEATFSHLVNVHGARRTPYCGPDKTLGYYAALAVGVNLRRAVVWEAGDRPKRERRLRLTRLLADRAVAGVVGPSA